MLLAQYQDGADLFTQRPLCAINQRPIGFESGEISSLGRADNELAKRLLLPLLLPLRGH